MLKLGIDRQTLAHETNNFLAQRIAGPRPGFRAAQMFHARLQIAEVQTVGARAHQGGNALFQAIEKCQLIPAPASCAISRSENEIGGGDGAKCGTISL